MSSNSLLKNIQRNYNPGNKFQLPSSNITLSELLNEWTHDKDTALSDDQVRIIMFLTFFDCCNP